MSDIVERLQRKAVHLDCDDCWYSCAILTCDSIRKSDTCDCGADTENALRADARTEIIRLRAELAAANERLAEVIALLTEWRGTEMDSMDEEFDSWIKDFSKRVDAIINAARKGE